MGHSAASIPDWRDDAAYAGLREADRSVLAWEWLRRDRGYRLAAAEHRARRGADHHAHEWGLHRFEDPDLPAPRARPLWTCAALDAVLRVETGGGLTGADLQAGEPKSRTPRADAAPDWADTLALARAQGMLTEMTDRTLTHVLIGDGWRVIRVDIVGSGRNARARSARVSIPWSMHLESQLLSLRRLAAFGRTGRLGTALHRAEPRVPRQVLLLRTADALADGANQRAIAVALLDPAAGRAAWRDERPDLRLQAQRLVRNARSYSAGGYKALLGGT